MAIRFVEQDMRTDDAEYNPALEPDKSKAWLNLLEESEKAFEDWNKVCDELDKQYASLARLSNYARDKEYQMFWANCEVLKPAIYSKPPVPVVVPKFKDRRPVYQAASEILERCSIVAFDLAYIDDVMMQLRDDLALVGRGVPWCRYESARDDNTYYNSERVCIDFKHRRDFLHSLSRCWYEVTWVAAASYLTRSEARERFSPHSGDAYQQVEYKVDKDTQEVGGTDNRERGKFWEIWDKTNRRVVWVAEGCEDILDESDPHLDLQNYFPCPKPAYSTCQRGSLVPVPEMLQYKDQLDEVNLLTSRIHALSDALEVRGFYPSGTSEIAEAVETAVKNHSPSRVLVPISDWAAFGGSKEVIIWLPIDVIAEVITALVALRKQVVDDIYQIMGLSDIMRGATNPVETLGAQELKTQYGSTRIRDKQYELVRIARDLVCITDEIILQNFSNKTIVEMSQTQLPTERMVKQQVYQLQQQAAVQQQRLQQLQQQQSSPQPQQAMPQDLDAADQQLQSAQVAVMNTQQDIQNALAQPTIEQVLTFLKNNRLRSFTLDIETDSTVMIDENADKQRHIEFLDMLAKVLPQLTQMVAGDPTTSEFCGEVLKFAVEPFRAGRSLDGAIDSLIEQMKARSANARPDDPQTAQTKALAKVEADKNERQRQKDQADSLLRAQELQMKDRHEQMKIASNEKIKMIELQAKRQDDAAKIQQGNVKMMRDTEKHQVDVLRQHADMMFDAQKIQADEADAIARRAEVAARSNERAAAQQFRMARGVNQQGPFGQ